MFTTTFARSIIFAVVLATVARPAPAGSSAPASVPSPSASFVPSSIISSPSSVAPVLSSAPLQPSSVASASSAPLFSGAPSSHVPSSSSEVPSGTQSVAAAQATFPYAPEDPNGLMWNSSYSGTPQAIRGSLGASVLGPQDVGLVKENPDLLAPPTTDAGTVGNAKWPFSLSHNRLQTGGWARQQNVAVLPMATQMAGVNMRLEVGAIRELHWHKIAEWAYVLAGNVQISTVNSDGQNYVATCGDGSPHWTATEHLQQGEHLHTCMTDRSLNMSDIAKSPSSVILRSVISNR